MPNYSAVKKYIYGEKKHNSNTAGFEASSEGINISAPVPAEPGEFKEFGFAATSGLIYTFAPDGGIGTGTLTADSAALFPITGDDKLYVITVRIDSVVNHRFEFAVNATTI